MNAPARLPRSSGPASSQPRQPMVDTYVYRHVTSGPGLLTVVATPPGVTSYVVADGDGTTVRDVRMEQGAVVTRFDNPDFGTVLSVCTTGSVVEVGLHDTQAQQDAYRAAAAAVDAEAQENAFAVMSAVVGRMLGELGFEARDGDDADDREEGQS